MLQCLHSNAAPPHCSCSRHCFQCGHFIDLSTCVNGLYFGLTRQYFPFRHENALYQSSPNCCQTPWVPLVHPWGSPSTCVCNRNTCAGKILHGALKHLWLCLIKSVWHRAEVNDALGPALAAAAAIHSPVLLVCVSDNPIPLFSCSHPSLAHSEFQQLLSLPPASNSTSLISSAGCIHPDWQFITIAPAGENKFF